MVTKTPSPMREETWAAPRLITKNEIWGKREEDGAVHIIIKLKPKKKSPCSTSSQQSLVGKPPSSCRDKLRNRDSCSLVLQSVLPLSTNTGAAGHISVCSAASYLELCRPRRWWFDDERAEEPPQAPASRHARRHFLILNLTCPFSEVHLCQKKSGFSRE